jgi:hypothetical protein
MAGRAKAMANGAVIVPSPGLSLEGSGVAYAQRIAGVLPLAG